MECHIVAIPLGLRPPTLPNMASSAVVRVTPLAFRQYKHALLETARDFPNRLTPGQLADADAVLKGREAPATVASHASTMQRAVQDEAAAYLSEGRRVFCKPRCLHLTVDGVRADGDEHFHRLAPAAERGRRGALPGRRNSLSRNGNSSVGSCTRCPLLDASRAHEMSPWGAWGPYLYFMSSETVGSGSLRRGTSGRRRSEHKFREGDRQAPAPGSAPCWCSVFSEKLKTCAYVKCFNTPFVFE